MSWIAGCWKSAFVSLDSFRDVNLHTGTRETLGFYSPTACIVPATCMLVITWRLYNVVYDNCVDNQLYFLYVRQASCMFRSEDLERHIASCYHVHVENALEKLTY